MFPVLMEAGADVSTHASVFESLTSIFTFLVGLLGDFVEVITTTPLMFVPVIIAFAGGAIMLVVSMIRRLGVRSGGGKRRYGR